MATVNKNFRVKNGLDAVGNITTDAGLQVGTTATINGNATMYGTTTLWSNQQLSLAVRTGQNWAGNLVQFSLNDTTVVGGIGSRGNIFFGSTSGVGINTYNLSATNPFVSSTQATFTVSTTTPGGSQPFAVGQKITVSGASQSQYNGSWIVTAVGGVNAAWTATVTSGSGTTPFSNGGAITATGTISVEPMASFKANAPSVVPLSIQNGGSSGNATDMFRLYDSLGNLRTYFSSSGDLVAPAIIANWQTDSRASDRNVTPLRARFTVSNAQTNIQTWESSSAVLAGVNAPGQIFTGGTTPARGSRAITIPTHTPTGTTDITLTLSATHNIFVGQTVEILGVTPSGYNGVWRAQNGTTGSTLVLNIGSNPGAITVAGSAYISPQVSVIPTSLASVGVLIKGVASQSANLFEVQDSTGAVLANITSVGRFNTNSADGYQIANAAGFKSLNLGQTALITAGTTVGTNPHFVVRQSASQTGDLQQWQTSTPTTVASISSAGVLTSTGLSLSSTTSPITLNGSAGTSGQVLTSAGAGATPTWTTVSGGSFTGGTLTSDLVLAAGSGTVEPLTFQTNSATPTATSGAMDYDGDKFYATTSGTATGRLMLPAVAWAYSNASATQATSSTAQSIFQAGARALTLEANKTYYFKLVLVYSTSFSAGGPSSGRLVPTFSQTPQEIFYAISTAYGATAFSGRITATTASQITPAFSSSGSGTTIIEGFFRTNATTGGTIEFKYDLNSGGSAGITMLAGCYQQITKLGSGAASPAIVSGAWA